MPKLRLRQPRFTVQKMKFSIKDFSSKCDHYPFLADLVKFTGEILNGKLLLLTALPNY